MSRGLFWFLTEQTQDTAPNVKNKQEKRGCGGFVIILHGLIMERPKQVHCFSSSQTSHRARPTFSQLLVALHLVRAMVFLPQSDYAPRASRTSYAFWFLQSNKKCSSL